MNDKEELLKDLYSEQKPQNLTFTKLLIAYFSVALILVIFIPKIYITNKIYYISRDVSELREELNLLLEENRELRTKLQQIRYKNQIIDNIN
nr:hypothetical protein [Campylobacter sp.]